MTALHETVTTTAAGLSQLAQTVYEDPVGVSQSFGASSLRYLDRLTSDPETSGQLLGHGAVVWASAGAGGAAANATRSIAAAGNLSAAAGHASAAMRTLIPSRRLREGLEEATELTDDLGRAFAPVSGERLVSGVAGRAGFTGSLSSRGVAAVNEAAVASGLAGRNLVDKVIVRAGNSAFTVEKGGRRILYLNEAVVGQANHGMLLREAAHELVHAQQYAKVLGKVGDVERARRAFLVSSRSYRYAVDEVVAETLAQRRIQKYLGNLSNSTLEWSNDDIGTWRSIYRARR